MKRNLVREGKRGDTHIPTKKPFTQTERGEERGDTHAHKHTGRERNG
jgi:hypothetical protein